MFTYLNHPKRYPDETVYAWLERLDAMDRSNFSDFEHIIWLKHRKWAQAASQLKQQQAQEQLIQTPPQTIPQLNIVQQTVAATDKLDSLPLPHSSRVRQFQELWNEATSEERVAIAQMIG